MTRGLRILSLALGLSVFHAHAADQGLIIVEDRGGVSVLPYYQALDLQPKNPRQVGRSPSVEIPALPADRYSEASMLPVRSTLLTPGTVERRVIQAPGLRPMFLVGDDERSHTWLRQRADTLRELGAIGLVVNVDSVKALERLRRLAPGLNLSPVAADDLAHRLGIRHYPVLITATGIEQ
jgi:integrating conjugative element protein (TIGR03765 family)